MIEVRDRDEWKKEVVYTFHIITGSSYSFHYLQREAVYATTCFLSFHPTSLSIHLFPQWFALNRTMQREAVACACGKVCVCQCVFAPAVVHRTILITYSSVWITLDAVLGM